MNKKKIRGKKSQSEVIATVLLILIAIAAVAVISGFLIPFIYKQAASKDCFDYTGIVEIGNDLKYTCYDNARGILNLQIKVGNVDDKVKHALEGFRLISENNGESSFYEISPVGGSTEVLMYNGGAISIPGKGEARTYNITLNIKPETVTIIPKIGSDRYCAEQAYKSIYINEC